MSTLPKNNGPSFHVHFKTMAKSFFSVTNPCPPHVFLLSLLLVLTTNLTFGQTPERKIVFTKWANAPNGWEHQNDSALYVFRPAFFKNVGPPSEFRFSLRAKDMNYTLYSANPGNYTIRFGMYEDPNCIIGKRKTKFIVNNVQSPIFDISSFVGCGNPFYLDVNFNVPNDHKIVFKMMRCCGGINPIISNIRLYAGLPSPLPQSETSPSPSPAQSMSSVSLTPTPSVIVGSIVPSSSPSSSITFPAPSPDSSSVPTSMTPTPSALPSSSFVTASLSLPPSMEPASPSVSAVSTPSVSSLLQTSPSATMSPSMSGQSIASATSSVSSSTPPQLPSMVIINVGPDYNIPGTSPVVDPSGSVDTSLVLQVTESYFYTGRKGASFTISIELSPGLYTVSLGFVELDALLCTPSARVFNVLINGFIRLESYDIYSTSGGCKKAVVETFVDQAVDPLNPVPLTISFVGVAEDAIVSYISVKAANENCDPISDDIQEDHLAHAVPGVYPPTEEPAYVDTLQNGFVNVLIDGSASHTHYANGELLGSITSYTWIIPETGQVVSTRAKFRKDFYLGTTRLRLIVVDNACSRDEAETSVTVTGNILPGAYCYYYSGLSEIPTEGLLDETVAPSYSSESSSISLGFPNFSFLDSNFVVRCTFFLQFDNAFENTVISVNTAGTGNARVFKGSELIIDSNTSSISEPKTTGVGFVAYDLIYRRTDLIKTPSLKFMVNGTIPAVFYDRLNVLPIIQSINPASGPLSGGAATTIKGYGLFYPLTIYFGNNSVVIDEEQSTPLTAVVLTPPSSVSQIVQVTAQTVSGLTSEALPYEYGSSCDPIAFDSYNLTNSDGSNLDLIQPTTVSLWQDGKIYVGTRQGIVKVVGYNADTLVVSSLCQSPIITDDEYTDKNGNPSQRAVLGITFDPRDTSARPYVAVSTLFWERQGGIELTNERAWSNGAIERLKPATPQTKLMNPDYCLEYDKNIVRYLPVSDGDHSVSEIVFSQDGDLLISVGGNTNAGLPYANLGGNFDAFYSGAVLVARLSKPGFNGEITYSTLENLRTAVPLTNDVELYATGVRNMFSMSMTRAGRIYATDNGPNCGFGNVSSSCSEYNETEAALRDTSNKVPFPGTAIVGEGDCKYGDFRKDKLLQIKPGKFYGYSNLIRGTRLNQPEECIWIDPLTGLSPPPAMAAAPPNYEPQMQLLKSATTGVREYGGNLFCGKLRGDLILSVYKGRRTYRVLLNSDGSYKEGPFVINDKSGLRVEETMHGDLIFPNYQDSVTYVLKPRIAQKLGVFASNAVPFRHGRNGGTLIRIGGWGFLSNSNASVTVGTKNCPVVELTENEIVCSVPSNLGGSDSVDVTVSVGSATSSLPNAVLYMNV